MNSNSWRRRRAGFTLIELIVVVTIILLLAGLAARFLPSATTSAREANAGALVQGWLNMAKQKALRDQSPRGLRLWNKNGDLKISECEFIELPDPYTGDPIHTWPAPPPSGSQNPSTVIFQGLSLTNGYPGTTNLWLVQPGDYISVTGGQMHQIASLQLDNPANPTQVIATLKSPLATPAYQVDPNTVPATLVGTQNYTVLRAPRPIGEESLQMPLDDTTPTALRGVVIDLSMITSDAGLGAFFAYNGIPNLLLASPYIDILFNPSGSAQVFVGNVVGGAALAAVQLTSPTGAPPRPLLALWVRSVDPSYTAAVPATYFEGDPTLVTIHVSNGYVGAYAPDPRLPAGNPYGNIK